MEANRVRIRTATSGDITSLIQLDLVARRDTQRELFIERAVEAGQCWVATGADGASSPAGFGVLNRPFFGQHFVPRIVVAEAARREGIGSAILHKLMSECAGAKIFTSTGTSNTYDVDLLSSGGQEKLRKRFLAVLADNCDGNGNLLVGCGLQLITTQLI